MRTKPVPTGVQPWCSADGHRPVGAPQIPIDVDPETGIWSTDGLPMIYMPRHFFVNKYKAVETVLGVDTYSRQLYDAGYQSAWYWCDKEAATHALSGVDVFRHYMDRISQRGWGRFTMLSVDTETGAADVRLDNSVFVNELGPDQGRNVCYMYTGWFAGALEWVGLNTDRRFRLCARESCCASNRAEHCLFEIRPA